MPQQINKLRIEFDTITYTRIKLPDQTFRYVETVSYSVVTDEEDIQRTRERNLSGAVRTAVETRFAGAETALKTVEGIP